MSKISTQERSSSIVLYSCVLEDAPEYLKNDRVVRVGVIRIDLSDMQIDSLPSKYDNESSSWRCEISYAVEACFRGKKGILDFKVTRDSRVIGSASLDLMS